MAILHIIVGLALLTLGRKLYWLFVAGIGFAGAAFIATRLMPDLEAWLAVLLALAAGAIGAFLAQALQRVALVLAGVVSGAVLVPSLVSQLGIEFGLAPWLLALLGALIGATLILTLFEWALILLSSGVGGMLLSQNLGLETPYPLVVLVVAAAAGILTQYRLWRA